MARSGISWRSLGASSRFRSAGSDMMDGEADATISQAKSLATTLAGSHPHSPAKTWISWRRWEPEGRW